MKLRILVIVRKLLVLFAIVAGVFAFQGTTPSALPREKVRIELVETLQAVEQTSSTFTPVSQTYFTVTGTLQKAQVFHPHLLTLLISSLQHHSSL